MGQVAHVKTAFLMGGIDYSDELLSENALIETASCIKTASLKASVFSVD